MELKPVTNSHGWSKTWLGSIQLLLTSVHISIRDENVESRVGAHITEERTHFSVHDWFRRLPLIVSTSVAFRTGSENEKTPGYFVFWREAFSLLSIRVDDCCVRDAMFCIYLYVEIGFSTILSPGTPEMVHKFCTPRLTLLTVECTPRLAPLQNASYSRSPKHSTIEFYQLYIRHCSMTKRTKMPIDRVMCHDMSATLYTQSHDHVITLTNWIVNSPIHPAIAIT